MQKIYFQKNHLVELLQYPSFTTNPRLTLLIVNSNEKQNFIHSTFFLQTLGSGRQNKLESLYKRDP
jgi:hypothetical protein